jgi:uncharacterized protein HemX
VIAQLTMTSQAQMQQPARAVTLVDQPVTLTMLGALVGLIMSVMGVVWTGSEAIATMRGDIRALAHDLEAARDIGRREREALSRRAVEMNQAQQAEIDRLRLEQQQMTAFISEVRTSVAEMRTSAGYMTAAIARIEQAVAPRPTGGR